MQDPLAITDPVIASVQQLTSTWFNHILARHGGPAESVSAVSIQQEDSTKAQIVRITLRYQEAATRLFPTKLLLKMCATEKDGFGSSEVDYYRKDYLDLADPPIPRCYDAYYSAVQGRYHILMNDYSETHRNNWHSLTYEYGLAVVQAMARLHAHHWGVQRLAAIGTHIAGPIEIANYFDHIRPGLVPMLQAAAGEIDLSWPGVLLDIFEHHPARMLERTSNPHGFTLIHGDLNPGNILSPCIGHTPIYLIDRQPFAWSLTAWLGVSDLSYMLVLWWDTELRRRWEFPLLRAYHACLIQNGVIDYSWEQLVADYKLCIIENIYVATEWCVSEVERTSMRWIWLRHLQRSMAAFFDLHCAELWS